MPIIMLAAMATAIAIIHVISAPINASNKPLSLTFGTRLEALLLHPQFVILLAANLYICEHFSVARPGWPRYALATAMNVHTQVGFVAVPVIPSCSEGAFLQRSRHQKESNRIKR